jgi:hypothetical protein
MLKASRAENGNDYREMMSGTFESESLVHQFIPSRVPKPLAWANYASNPERWFRLCAFPKFQG